MFRCMCKIFLMLILSTAVWVQSASGAAPAMKDYCIKPPFISASVPPLVMFVMSKDHKLFYRAYSDTVDLDKDGSLDVTYKDSINYYGYFDPMKCYSYDSGAKRFVPSSYVSGYNSSDQTTTNHYCSGAWSGNFLNWSAMARVDVMRKVIYGGKRTSDSGTLTVLSRSRLPQDSHSWAKTYTGSDLASLAPVGSNTAITMCNTNTSNSGDQGNASLMRVVLGNAANGPSAAGGYFPYAASTEGKQCVKGYDGGANLAWTDYFVDVEVCNSTVGVEPNCLLYKDASNNTTLKPVGLMQSQGINPVTGQFEMFFGLITGSYKKNLSGGVLRSNITDVNSEFSSTTGILSGASSKIIKTLDNLEIKDWDYGSGNYSDCGLISSISEGNCKVWGNPIGEMYYEALRYYMGKGTPTTTFDPGTDTGYTSLPSTPASQFYNPYVQKGLCGDSQKACPSCANPYILILSDVYSSYDSDQLPGSNWATSLNPNDTGLNVQTLIDNSDINNLEGISSAFIGDSGGASPDNTCSAKTVNLKTTRGLCPEEPAKQGAYYLAGLAHWGRTVGFTNVGQKFVRTFAVATPSVVPELEFDVSGNKVQIIPSFKDITIDSRGQIADFRVLAAPGISCPGADWHDPAVAGITNDCQFETGTNGYQYAYEIAFDDSAAGNDYDLDVRYRLYVKMNGSNITVKTKGVYANAGHTDRPGYLIRGVGTANGEYLELSCGSGTTDCTEYCNGNCSSPSILSHTSTGMAIVERSFTASGSNADVFLKNPLWYATKYGAFRDTNGNKKPDIDAEWQNPSTGDPLSYFYASNPLELETQLRAAFDAIKSDTTSGTAVAMLTSSEGTGANLVQAVYYPTRTFGFKEISWISEMQNLWYYVDPFLGNAAVHEDTDGDKKLKLGIDNIAQISFDGSSTVVFRYENNADGSIKKDVNGVPILATTPDTNPVDFENMTTSLWRAGTLLHQRNTATDPRTIYVDYNADKSLDAFSAINAAALRPYLNVATNTEATNIINYVRGTDITGYRTRTVTWQGNTDVWRLGDIISSTPKIQGPSPLHRYHLNAPEGYGDNSYNAYVTSKNYVDRGMVYAGANDGMFHAFKLGKLVQSPATGVKAELQGSNLGREEWSFVPRGALPYMKYLKELNYCHLYYVDGPTVLVDASIKYHVDCSAANYWNCLKQTIKDTSNVLDTTKTSWRTIAVGSSGLGGACRNYGSCGSNADCVASAINTAGQGLTSYFALDVTDPSSPTVLWEFSNTQLGFATTGPAIVRVGTRGENGRWFAIFGSGPTGPIDTINQQFLGRSDQNLRLFIVDLASGALVRTIDTGISNAFAGAMIGSALDVDRSRGAFASGNYIDDVVYIPYVRKGASSNKWDDGGVLRLVTKDATTTVDSTDPNNWALSTVIDGVGPVTAMVTKLIDNTFGNLWLYFGTGRYYYKSGTVYDDDTSQRRIYGIKEPCFQKASGDLNDSCSLSVSVSDLTDRTTVPANPSVPDKGWFINLATATGPDYAERILTDPVASFNGVVFFSSFTPSTDPCAFSGSTGIWGMKYDTGGAPLASQLVGKVLLQVSTGAVQEVDLSSAFTQQGGRRTTNITGGPPVGAGSGMAIIMKPKPLRKIIHVKER